MWAPSSEDQPQIPPNPKRLDGWVIAVAAIIFVGLLVVGAIIASGINQNTNAGEASGADHDKTPITYIDSTGETPIITSPPTGTTNYDSYSNVNVVISYDGEWSGSVGSVSSSSSYDGVGGQTITVYKDGSYLFIVSAVVQKMDSGSGTLTVKIVSPSGTVLQSASTSAQYGVATVSWSQ